MRPAKRSCPKPHTLWLIIGRLVSIPRTAWPWMPIALLLLTSFFGRVAFAEPQPQWTATWGSAQLRPSSTDTPLSTAFQGATLTQVVHLSIGGSALRLHLSNAFGESPLVLRAVQVSLRRCAAPSSIEPGTQTLVTFHGDTRVSIPSGVEYLSDPIAINVLAFSDTVITMLVESAPATLTFHAGARATSYLMPGDHTADSHFDAAQTFAHWFFLAGVEVERDPPSSAVSPWAIQSPTDVDRRRTATIAGRMCWRADSLPEGLVSSIRASAAIIFCSMDSAPMRSPVSIAMYWDRLGYAS